MVRAISFHLVLWPVLFTHSTDGRHCNVGDDVNLMQVQVQHRERIARNTNRETPGTGKCSLHQLPTSSEPPRNFSKFDHGSWYQGLYVNPSSKFAFCLIEKNACSAWGTVLNKLQRFNLDAGYSENLVRDTFSPDVATAVFTDTAATRAVFVRDPLERFLSAFLDKCLSGTCDRGVMDFCGLMRKPEQKGQPIPFRQAVEWLQTQNVSSPDIDGHWRSQSHHCELHSRLHEYTLLGFMDKKTLAKNAACLLDRAGLNFLNTQSSEASASAFWQVPDAASSSSGATTEYLKSFYSKEAAEIVYSIFKDDYDLFKLPRPDWMDNAHGSFFLDTRPSKCAQNSKDTTASDPELSVLQRSGHNKNVGSVLEDIDDIPILAQRAGFVL